MTKMRIALVGATTAGKSSIANDLANYIGLDYALVHDVDEFVAEKWNLEPPGLRRLWLRELTADEQRTGISNLIAEREAEFQDRLDIMPANKINIIAMGTHVYRNSPLLQEQFYLQEPRRQWWSRFVQDAMSQDLPTYILRLDIAARDMHVRMLKRYQRWKDEYQDMEPTFKKWADRQVWNKDGKPNQDIEAMRSLHNSQIIDLLPHYWALPNGQPIPSLLVVDGHQVAPQDILAALNLPAERDLLRAMVEPAH